MYDQCPLKAKLVHIDKLREPENDALIKGSLVHKLAEQYVRGQLKKYPPELGAAFKDRFAELKKLNALLEQDWAFNKDWGVVGWFAKDAWCRIKMDLHYLLTTNGKTHKANSTRVVTIDYKTGREHQEHAQQRSLYALGAFHMYPDANAVRVEHWYLDHGTVGIDEFVRSDVKKLLTQWEQRTRAMLADKRFAPCPGSYCRWCHFRKSNGGPCIY